MRSYPRYRDSGAEWLDALPEHWDLRQLGLIGSLFKGSGGTKEDEVPEGAPCVRYGDIYTKHQYFIRETRADISEESAANYTPIRYGDILFAGSGETIAEIGKSAVNLIDGTAYCGGDVIVFRPSIEADATFLGYAADCSTSIHQKACMGRGVTVMHIYSQELRHLLLPLPPLDEQRAIAAFLDRETERIDALVAKKRLLIERLKEYRTALITRTVTRGLPPEAARAAGLDPSPRLKPSGVEWLGDVPEHWGVRPLKAVLVRNDGGVWGDEADGNDGTIVLRSTEQTIDGGWSIGDPAKRTLSAREETSARLRVGDLVVTKSSGSVLHIGKTSLVTEEVADLGACFSNFMQRLRCLPSLDPKLAWYLLNSPVGRQQLVFNSNTTTGLANLNRTILSEVVAPIPPIQEQRAIVGFLDREAGRVDGLTQQVERAIERLQEYRTALITAAVTGKIDVRESIAHAKPTAGTGAP